MAKFDASSVGIRLNRGVSVLQISISGTKNRFLSTLISKAAAGVAHGGRGVDERGVAEVVVAAGGVGAVVVGVGGVGAVVAAGVLQVDRFWWVAGAAPGLTTCAGLTMGSLQQNSSFLLSLLVLRRVKAPQPAWVCTVPSCSHLRPQ